MEAPHLKQNIHTSLGFRPFFLFQLLGFRSRKILHSHQKSNQLCDAGTTLISVSTAGPV